MKKIALFFALVIAATMFSACGGEEETNVQTNGETNTQQENTNLNVVPDEGVVENPTEFETKAQEDFDAYSTVINSEDRSVNDCEGLEDEDLKNRCLSIVYTQLAEENVDNSYCSEIILSDLQKECNARVDEINNPEDL